MTTVLEKPNKKFILPPEWRDKLGTVPDRLVAEALGVSIQTIYGVRTNLKIKPCGKHERTHHTKMEPDMYDLLIKELGTVKDNHLAKKYGISREYIRQLRIKNSIEKFSHQKVQVHA